MTAETPEAVALALLRIIAFEEKKATVPAELNDGYERASRQWVLETYSACLRAASGRPLNMTTPLRDIRSPPLLESYSFPS